MNKEDFWGFVDGAEQRYQPTRNPPEWLIPRQRALLVDWMAAVCLEFQWPSQTLHRAVNTLDRYMGSESVFVPRDELSTVALAALTLSNKFESAKVPSMKTLQQIHDTPRLAETEWAVAHALGFDVGCVTASECIDVFGHSNDKDLLLDLIEVHRWADVSLLTWTGLQTPKQRAIAALSKEEPLTTMPKSMSHICDVTQMFQKRHTP